MKKLLISVLLLGSIVSGQNNEVTLDVTITPYVTYYISTIDLETGESTIPIFSATLTPVSTDPKVSIYFEMIINSEALDMSNKTLFKIESKPFVFSNPIILSNMDMNMDTREIFDVQGNQISFVVPSENIEHLDLDEADAVFNQVVQTGRLPDGTYTFIIRIIDGDDNVTVLETYQESIQITTPTYLQLASPGGILADTTENELYTSYPVFQWESDQCNVPGGCSFYIKVAEFDPEIHSSADEAIESLTRLPLDQAANYYYVGNSITTFQYPTTDAGDLEPGKVYVWQILKVMGSTEGAQGILSEIFSFKIKDLTATSQTSDGEDEILTTEKIALKSLMGESMFNALNAQFPGFIVNAIKLDDNEVDMTSINSLLNQGVAVVDSTGVTTYRPMNITSVEVME